MLSETEMRILRQELEKGLKRYKETEKIKFNMSHNMLERLIFLNEGKRKVIAFDFELIKKLDLSNVSFDNVAIIDADFTGSTGAIIDPQTIYDKSFEETKLTDVEINGSFVGVNVYGTDFTGSKGAKIDPQTVRDKLFYGTKLTDVKINGSFEGVNVYKADFTGAIISSKIDFYNEEYQDIEIEFVKKLKL